jgi:hypothetical protein
MGQKVKAWLLWSSARTGDEPVFIEAFATKEGARARIRRLLANAPWRKASDYDIRQGMIDINRIFERRK